MTWGVAVVAAAVLVVVLWRGWQWLEHRTFDSPPPGRELAVWEPPESIHARRIVGRYEREEAHVDEYGRQSVVRERLEQYR